MSEEKPEINSQKKKGVDEKAQDNVTKLQLEIKKLRSENALLKEQGNKNIGKKKGLLKEQLKKARNDLASQVEYTKTVEEEKRTLEEKLAIVNKEVAERNNCIEQLERKLEDLELKHVKQEVHDLKHLFNKLYKRMADLQQQIKELSEQKAESQAESNNGFETRLRNLELQICVLKLPNQNLLPPWSTGAIHGSYPNNPPEMHGNANFSGQSYYDQPQDTAIYYPYPQSPRDDSHNGQTSMQSGNGPNFFNSNRGGNPHSKSKDNKQYGPAPDPASHNKQSQNNTP